MKIIVVGCGKVGLALVEQLTHEGHDITVVDKNADRLKNALSNLDVMTYVGDGSSYTTLSNAGIKDADLLIAVMDSDETNLLCSVIAKKTGDCFTIARVRKPIYSREIPFLRRTLDVDMIFNPELATAEEIARIFNFPYASKIDVFLNRKVELVYFRVLEESKLANLQLSDIRAKYNSPVLVCLVARQDKIIIPNGDFVLESGDMVGIMGARKDTHEFFKMFGVNARKIPDAMIVGGGKIGYYLAKLLIDSGIKVKVIESDRERCEFLSETLTDADIIFGDGTDKNLLIEEGIQAAAGLAALTSIDEENILLSLFAKTKVSQKTITKINRINYDEVIEKLPLDTIVNPNKISTDMIVRFVRSKEYTKDSETENYRSLADGKAEALEFVIKQDSDVVDIPLMDLKIKKNILICCIHRNEQIIIPKGADTLQVGDHVVIVHTQTNIDTIDDILA